MNDAASKPAGSVAAKLDSEEPKRECRAYSLHGRMPSIAIVWT